MRGTTGPTCRIPIVSLTITSAANFQELLGGRNVKREVREPRGGVQTRPTALVGPLGKSPAEGLKQCPLV